MKNSRHNVIMSIIGAKKIRTHEQLISELKELGYNVTQATISRDIKLLGLSKFSDAEGSYYGAGNEMGVGFFSYTDYVLSVDFGCNLIVIKTKPGTASVVASTIDSMFEADILGSIAGDDAIFVATKSEENAIKLTEKLKGLFGKTRD